MIFKIELELKIYIYYFQNVLQLLIDIIFKHLFECLLGNLLEQHYSVAIFFLFMKILEYFLKFKNLENFPSRIKNITESVKSDKYFENNC